MEVAASDEYETAHNQGPEEQHASYQDRPGESESMTKEELRYWGGERDWVGEPEAGELEWNGQEGGVGDWEPAQEPQFATINGGDEVEYAPYEESEDSYVDPNQLMDVHPDFPEHLLAQPQGWGDEHQEPAPEHQFAAPDYGNKEAYSPYGEYEHSFTHPNLSKHPAQPQGNLHAYSIPPHYSPKLHPIYHGKQLLSPTIPLIILLRPSRYVHLIKIPTNTEGWPLIVGHMCKGKSHPVIYIGEVSGTDIAQACSGKLTWEEILGSQPEIPGKGCE